MWAARWAGQRRGLLVGRARGSKMCTLATRAGEQQLGTSPAPSGPSLAVLTSKLSGLGEWSLKVTILSLPPSLLNSRR